MEVYLITNNANGKRYVGITARGADLRLREHIRQSRTDKYTRGLHGAMKKYPSDVFSIEVIDTADNLLDLEELEVKYIKHFNTMAPNGYNLKSGGFEGFYTDEVRSSMSAKRVGVKASDQARANMSAAQKGRPRTQSQLDALDRCRYGNKHGLGRIVTKEQREKISKANTGKVRSDEVKAVLSSLNSGDKHPQSDKTPYQFINDNGDSFSGTRCQFKDSIGFCCGKLFGTSPRLKHKGWKIA